MRVCCRFADGDEIEYNPFLAGINWEKDPAPPVTPEDILRVSEKDDSNSYKTRRDERGKKEKNFLNEAQSEGHGK